MIDEELKHIDLIDKYLNDKLNTDEAAVFEQLLQEDVDFRKELDVYKKIHKRIEDRGEENLKERLTHYYKEYQNEKSVKPKGLYRKLIIISGIAAAIIFGIFLVNNSPDNQLPIFKPSDPGVVDITKDSLKPTNNNTIDVPIEEELAQEEEKVKDTSLFPNKYTNNTQLSIGGLLQLPAASVRSIEYPISLQYTFDSDKLTLFGNPSISSLQLQVVKNDDGHYFLKYKNEYYQIDKTSSKKLLTVTLKSFSTKQATEEKIKIKLKGIEEVSHISKELKVAFTGNKSISKTYFFERKENIYRLIIDGFLNNDNTKVYSIHQRQEITYFLKIDKKLYQLDSKTKEPASLKETYILTNKLTQLFREDRELPRKMVYLVE